jgi:molecular chaperone DnaK (HSP70)
MADQFLSDTGIDLRQDRLALQRLKEVAESALSAIFRQTRKRILTFRS